jgi:hypothetical protein
VATHKLETLSRVNHDVDSIPSSWGTTTGTGHLDDLANVLTKEVKKETRASLRSGSERRVVLQQKRKGRGHKPTLYVEGSREGSCGTGGADELLRRNYREVSVCLGAGLWCIKANVDSGDADPVR